jgi:hypothetical protein
MSTTASNLDFSRTTVVRTTSKKSSPAAKAAPLPRFESGMVEESAPRQYNWIQRKCLQLWGVITARPIA